MYIRLNSKKKKKKKKVKTIYPVRPPEELF